MKIFAISDPHLSFEAQKPMDIFGDNWDNHPDKIKRNWLSTVHEDDIVLVPGDISWSMKLPSAMTDLLWLSALPGQKVIVRGNHDYWWSSMKKIREAVPDNMHFIQNDSVTINGVSIGGSRLWDFPFVYWPFEKKKDADTETNTDKELQGKSSKGHQPDPEKVRASEIQRLHNSLQTLDKSADVKICLTHYPPVSATPERNELTEIVRSYDCDWCVYGHLHAISRDNPPQGTDCEVDGVRYAFASCDWLNFMPLLIKEF